MTELQRRYLAVRAAISLRECDEVISDAWLALDAAIMDAASPDCAWPTEWRRLHRTAQQRGER